jgi:hypothetical protein
MEHGEVSFSAASMESSCIEALVKASDLGDMWLQTWDSQTAQPHHRPKVLKLPTPEKTLRRPKGTKQIAQKHRLLLDVVPAMVSFKPFLRPTCRPSDKDWVGMRGVLRKAKGRGKCQSMDKLELRISQSKPDLRRQRDAKEHFEARITAALTAKRPSAIQHTSMPDKRRSGKQIPVCRSLGSPRNSIERRLITPASILLLPFKSMKLG